MKPDLQFFKYCFHVHWQTTFDGDVATCGAIKFYHRQHTREWYPRIPYLDCNRRWTSTFFYCRDVPAAEDGIDILVFVNSPPTPRDSWDEKAAMLPDCLRLIQRRIEFLT